MGALAEADGHRPNFFPNLSVKEAKLKLETRKRRKRKKRENQRQGGRLWVRWDNARALEGGFPKRLSTTKNERQMKHQEFPPPPSREEAEANPVALLELREHLSRERLVKVEEAKVSEPAPKMLKSPTVSDEKYSLFFFFYYYFSPLPSAHSFVFFCFLSWLPQTLFSPNSLFERNWSFVIEGKEWTTYPSVKRWEPAPTFSLLLLLLLSVRLCARVLTHSFPPRTYFFNNCVARVGVSQAHQREQKRA